MELQASPPSEMHTLCDDLASPEITTHPPSEHSIGTSLSGNLTTSIEDDLTLPSDLLPEHLTFSSDESVSADSSDNSSVIAPSVSPLQSIHSVSYSCGSPTPSPLSLSIFESEEAAAALNQLEAATTLDKVELPKQSSPGYEQQIQNVWCGFKLVMDNIDMNISPSFQRVDKTKKSLHYVHTYAVKDRVDLSIVSDKPPAFCKRDAIRICCHQQRT